MLNYNHLFYFHVAATQGSVGAAAERLGVTQPTVSEQLRSLERTLGLTLFERTPSGLKLTESGRLAFEQTSVMFRAGERLIEVLGHVAQGVPRSLRIGLSSAVARSTTADFLMPLLALDDCMPTIRTGDAVELLRELRANDLDLVLCENEPTEIASSGYEVALVTRTPLVAIGPMSVEPAVDWQDVALVQYRASSSLRWEVETFLDAQGLRPRIAAEVDDASFLVEAVVRGGYVAVVPRSVAREAVTAGKVRVIAQLETGHAGVFALYQDGSGAELARRAVRVLIEHAQLTQEG
jgi:LysR family transcriptional activator of nhaA